MTTMGKEKQKNNQKPKDLGLEISQKEKNKLTEQTNAAKLREVDKPE